MSYGVGVICRRASLCRFNDQNITCLRGWTLNGECVLNAPPCSAATRGVKLAGNGHGAARAQRADGTVVPAVQQLGRRWHETHDLWLFGLRELLVESYNLALKIQGHHKICGPGSFWTSGVCDKVHKESLLEVVVRLISVVYKNE